MAESLTYEKILELFAETDRQFKETDRKFKETDKKIGEIAGTLGRFVEGLVEPKLLELFKKRGINLTEILHNIEIYRNGQKDTEIDLLLINSDYSIAVEIKTTLTVEGVNEHLKRLDKLKNNPPKYIKGTILIGAVAGMRIEEKSDKYAYRQGLFVLKQKGELVEIANDDKFKPREWGIR
ncbi:hypothetical protein ES703_70906 [subsurface metagenome]